MLSMTSASNDQLRSVHLVCWDADFTYGENEKPGDDHKDDVRRQKPRTLRLGEIALGQGN